MTVQALKDSSRLAGGWLPADHPTAPSFTVSLTMEVVRAPFGDDRR